MGGARRILEEEVQNTLKRYGDRRRLGEAEGLFRDRSSFSDVVELTSRVGTDKVAEARRRLGCTFHDRRQRVDSAIATNMISVGLDIQRLGLMLVYGQPKTHSEYIQATSRVGRDDRRPGLVVTLYNIHKPRDRSHYERFRHYHETFYRSVEVSSVTPFAARALDRGFAGALVALARHARPAMTPPEGVEGVEVDRAALERLLLDVFGARIQEQPFADDTERAERLRSIRNRVGDLFDVLDHDLPRVPPGRGSNAVPEVRSRDPEAAASRHAGYRLRIHTPREVSYQPIASRCRAAGERVSEGSLEPARWGRRRMNGKGHGQLRRSQVITTFGPGALIDLPNDSAIVGGLDTWGSETSLEPIDEPRLSAKLMSMTGVPGPRLYAPPPEPESWQDKQRGIGAWRFPEWFVVQESGAGPGAGARSSSRSRRMVPRTALTNGRYEKQPVVATRFVRACSKGHVDDIDWYQFVHGPDDPCRRRLWLDERGTSGDLVEQIVRCECGKSRRMHEAVDFASFPLGVCRGARPWLGRHANEECREPSRLLIRTASNAWFPQVVSVLSLPDRGSEVDQAVEVLWDRLQIVKDANALAVMKNFPDVANGLASFSDQEVLDAIAARNSGGAAGDRPIKHAELDALLAVPEGYGDDAPIHPDFHARRLPESVWRHSARLDSIEAVIQVHRLREVLALAGFTRLEPVMPNVDGEYDGEVERASIALEPAWFPAVENRGEGILVQLRADAVAAWLDRDPVKQRLDELIAGHNAWAGQRKSERPFPGGPYVLLHTLAHLLIQSLSMRCGYPAASIRERIFVDEASSRSERNVPEASARSERHVPRASAPGERSSNDRRYALLLYTASPDAEGTLGGLVQEARRIEGPPAVRTSDRGALFQRSGVRGAHPRSEHGGALVARRCLPRLHADRGDFLRDAKRVPGPGLGGTDSVRAGRRVLRCAVSVERVGCAPEMTDAKNRS